MTDFTQKQINALQVETAKLMTEMKEENNRRTNRFSAVDAKFSNIENKLEKINELLQDYDKRLLLAPGKTDLQEMLNNTINEGSAKLLWRLLGGVFVIATGLLVSWVTQWWK